MSHVSGLTERSIARVHAKCDRQLGIRYRSVALNCFPDYESLVLFEGEGIYELMEDNLCPTSARVLGNNHESYDDNELPSTTLPETENTCFQKIQENHGAPERDCFVYRTLGWHTLSSATPMKDMVKQPRLEYIRLKLGHNLIVAKISAFQLDFIGTTHNS